MAARAGRRLGDGGAGAGFAGFALVDGKLPGRPGRSSVGRAADLLLLRVGDDVVIVESGAPG